MNKCSSDGDVVEEVKKNMSYKTFKYIKKYKWLEGIAGVDGTAMSYDPEEMNCRCTDQIAEFSGCSRSLHT